MKLDLSQKTAYNEEGDWLRIYMDVCCLNRPFDDLSQERIYLEAEAVLHIISRCDAGEWILQSSNAIDFELSKLSDEDKYDGIMGLLSSSIEYIMMNKETIYRAHKFQAEGVKVLDSYHLALAEKVRADILLTTDDRFIRKAERTDAKVRVENPVKWFMEVTI